MDGDYHRVGFAVLCGIFIEPFWEHGPASESNDYPGDGGADGEFFQGGFVYFCADIRGICGAVWSGCFICRTGRSLKMQKRSGEFSARFQRSGIIRRISSAKRLRRLCW